jgi:hypothetical protein
LQDFDVAANYAAHFFFKTSPWKLHYYV